jgi:hypothetical protein
MPIQRSAPQSWELLHPDVEVILFGDDEGAARVCHELGVRPLRSVLGLRSGDAEHRGENDSL